MIDAQLDGILFPSYFIVKEFGAKVNFTRMECDSIWSTLNIVK